MSGYPEENLFVVTAALGLKDMGGIPGSGDVPLEVPVTGLRVEPDSADCTIRVTRPAVLPTALALTPQSLLLTVGGSAALAISFTPPETTERAVTWSTSNPAVATVLGGSVQAVGVGTARITAASVADAEVRAVCFGPGTEATHHYERTHRDAVDASIRLLAVYLQSEIA